MTTVLADVQRLRARRLEAWDDSLFESLRSAVEARLDSLSQPAGGRESRVESAVRYALLAPGKRIRPLLGVLSALQLGAAEEAALDAAYAIEMVHAASLILDDLPCMDDAEMRRGRPATHRVYGEAAAVLAAVALLNRAFAVLAAADALPAREQLAQVGRLAAAIGAEGLIGGQEADLAERAGYDCCDKVDALNHRKTGVLFALALEFGARCAGAGAATVESMRQAGVHLGLAFQTLDDLLDQTRASAELGKDANKDAQKPSVVSLAGLEAARLRVRRELEAALACAAEAGGDPDPLRAYLEAVFRPAWT